MMNRDLLQLRAENKELRRRITQRPIPILVPLSVRKIVIDRGNTLDTTQLGIKYVSSVASVPSAYDPNVTTAFIDGVGRGTLYVNGVQLAGFVLVVNDSRSSFGHALLGENGSTDGPDDAWAFYAASIPVDGGGAVLAWVVG